MGDRRRAAANFCTRYGVTFARGWRRFFGGTPPTKSLFFGCLPPAQPARRLSPPVASFTRRPDALPDLLRLPDCFMSASTDPRASNVRIRPGDNERMALAAAKTRVALVDLTEARFENTFVESLPADPVLVNVPRQVANAGYTRAEPTPVAAPRLLAWSDRLGEFLGLARPSAEAVEVLGGNRVLPGMQPYA